MNRTQEYQYWSRNLGVGGDGEVIPPRQEVRRAARLEKATYLISFLAGLLVGLAVPSVGNSLFVKVLGLIGYLFVFIAQFVYWVFTTTLPSAAELNIDAHRFTTALGTAISALVVCGTCELLLPYKWRANKFTAIAPLVIVVGFLALLVALNEGLLRALNERRAAIQRELEEAYSFETRGELGSAIKGYRRVLQQDPTNTYAREAVPRIIQKKVERAYQLEVGKDLYGARDAYNGVLQDDPNHRYAKEAVVRVVERIRQMEAVNREVVAVYNDLERVGRFCDARRAYDKIKSAHPDNPEVKTALDRVRGKINAQGLSYDLRCSFGADADTMAVEDEKMKERMKQDLRNLVDWVGSWFSRRE